jgi:hypothetical protein
LILWILISTLHSLIIMAKQTQQLPTLPHDEIASLAYSIYEKRGRQPGHHLDDWLEAEAQLLGRQAPDDDDDPALRADQTRGVQRPRLDTVNAKAAGGKKPLDPREYPLARDERGSASRAEIRRFTVGREAPRESQRQSR